MGLWNPDGRTKRQQPHGTRTLGEPGRSEHGTTTALRNPQDQVVRRGWLRKRDSSRPGVYRERLQETDGGMLEWSERKLDEHQWWNGIVVCKWLLTVHRRQLHTIKPVDDCDPPQRNGNRLPSHLHRCTTNGSAVYLRRLGYTVGRTVVNRQGR